MEKQDEKKVMKTIHTYNQKYPENIEIRNFEIFKDLESLIELEIYLKQIKKEMNQKERLGRTYDWLRHQYAQSKQQITQFKNFRTMLQ